MPRDWNWSKAINFDDNESWIMEKLDGGRAEEDTPEDPSVDPESLQRHFEAESRQRVQQAFGLL